VDGEVLSVNLNPVPQAHDSLERVRTLAMSDPFSQSG
jgi:hypothetical protein